MCRTTSCLLTCWSVKLRFWEMVLITRFIECSCHSLANFLSRARQSIWHIQHWPLLSPTFFTHHHHSIQFFWKFFPVKPPRLQYASWQLQYVHYILSCNYSRCLQLWVALDKYTQNGTQQDCQFKFVTYLKTFTSYMNMQCQINQVPKHATKTRELWVTWAGRYMIPTLSQSTTDQPKVEQLPNQAAWCSTVATFMQFYVD